MLDQMSGGRLELGIGRGVSPFETRAYGLDFAQTGEIYHEAFQLILKGLASDELTFEGKHYQFHKVPMILRPLQRPHPPLWYGITIPENADWPAANDVNIVTIALRPTVRMILDRYRAERARLGKAHHPFMGVARHLVVADSDEAALAIARRAYPRWRGNFRPSGSQWSIASCRRWHVRTRCSPSPRPCQHPHLRFCARRRRGRSLLRQLAPSVRPCSPEATWGCW